MENHHHQHDPAAESDWAAMAELLDLDADVLHSYLSEVTAWVYERAAELPRRRILDLGSGTGTGALALVQCFAEADVIALDKSAQLLARCQAKARELGVEDRIRTVQADLDAAWPVIDPVDLVWASSSLHHMADPDRVLTEVFTAIHPGGLLAVAEMDSFPRFLPDDAALGLPRTRSALPCRPGRRNGRARSRISAPTGAHACGKPDSPSRPNGPSSSI